jgi:hypothetical protein
MPAALFLEITILSNAPRLQGVSFTRPEKMNSQKGTSTRLYLLATIIAMLFPSLVSGYGRLLIDSLFRSYRLLLKNPFFSSI